MSVGVRFASNLAVAVTVSALLVSGATEASAQTIHQQIQKHIPQVIEYLGDNNVKTVGVLKFRVSKPGERMSDSVGTLNSLLADRLEVGLILANPFNEAKQLFIIKDASSQALQIPGASHLNDSGRAAFFGPKFRLAWGDRTLAADAFLTGVVRVHEDGQRVTVGILCFTRDGGPLEKPCDIFEADLDAGSLSEMGESFVLRGAFDGGSTRSDDPKPTPKAAEKRQEKKEQKAVEAAVQVKTQQTSFPLNDTSAPVRLEMTYDGRPVVIQSRGGRAFVSEPSAGQRVEMAIVRTANAKGRLGIVLRVNGENTLYRQTIRDLDCSKWILSDEHTRTVIKGYQMANSNTAEKFTVLSSRESAKRAVDYGRNVGQIQMTVFKEEDFLNATDLPPSLPDEEEEDLAAIMRGTQPARTPANLSVLKQQVRTAGRDQSTTRGLIVQGEKQNNEVRSVKFVPDPTPVMSVTITYFKPAD